jgi:hypothetical protein
MKKLALITCLLSFACLPLYAQQAASPNEDTTVVISSDEANDTDMDVEADQAAPYIIFSNLGSKTDLYNNDGPLGKAIVGRQVNQITERWDAVRFVPKVDVQASVLEAAVQYVAGEPAVQLSLYASDIFGNPGTPLPGGQGSTIRIPDKGECCQLAKVVLPQPVTLNANTVYWLVGSPGSKDFQGVWQVSHLGERATLLFPFPWALASGEWPAARIRGTKLQTLGPLDEEKQKNGQAEAEAATGRIKIFSNLNPFFSQPYIPGVGLLVIGNDVNGYSETWEALPFTPKTDVRAKTLNAAIAWTSAFPAIIDLGIYTDNGGLPGALLTGSQGTAEVPLSGQCCTLATARLSGSGIALTGGVQYWLVASPNSGAENFMGIWQPTTNANWARIYPEQDDSWTQFNGDWMAAEIIGTHN